MPNTSAPRAGARLTCANCGTGVMVVRPPAEVLICCGGVMGEPVAGTAPSAAEGASPRNAAQLGKRHSCGTCGAEVLVIKAGSAVPHCDSAEMSLAATRQLPSSD